MDVPLHLYVLAWGMYPRRVLIYLAEKGLLSSPLIKITNIEITFNGVEGPEDTPKGTFPVLRLPDGTLIRQSIAILDYLEDVCDRPDPSQAWQVELSNSVRDGPNMRGETAQERARTRDMISMADEATIYFGFACHKGAQIFLPMETSSPMASKLALEYCTKSLKPLAQYYAADPRVENGGQVTIADCTLFATLQYAYDMYEKELLADPDLEPLRRFYEAFGKRESVKEKVVYPESIKSLCKWLPVEGDK